MTWAGWSGVNDAVKVTWAIDPEVAVTEAEPAAVPAVHLTLPKPCTSVTTVDADTVPPLEDTLKETGMPALGLSNASVTRTTSELSRSLPTLAVWPSPLTSVSLLAGADVAFSAKDSGAWSPTLAATV